jgi:hypothetical protein
MITKFDKLSNKLIKFYSKNGIEKEKLKDCINLNISLYEDIKLEEVQFLGLRKSNKLVFIEFCQDRYINLLIYAGLFYNFSLSDVINLEELLREHTDDMRFINKVNEMLELNKNLSDEVKLWIRLK